MTRGPRPTPTVLRVLRGNPGHRPINQNEPQPFVPDDCPAPPAHVIGHAAEEWNRIAPELYRLGLLTVADIGPLAAYCGAYARWRTAEETIQRLANNDPELHAMLVETECGVGISPLIKIARWAANDMVRFAGEFGLSPAARCRIAAGPFGEVRKSKFDGLLAS